jgi:mono/diheme cytochrome c family protein
VSDPNPNKPSFFNPDPTTRLAWGAFRRWSAPIWLQLTGVTFIAASWLPIAVAIEWRTDMAKREPRVHIIQDMDNQTKFKAQDESTLFNDHRAQRPRVVGTVARGELFADVAYFDGYTEAVAADGKVNRTFIDGYPSAIQTKLDNPDQARQLLALGEQKFNITCAVCHGKDGQGNGPIAQRAASVGALATGWTQPNNLTDEVRRGRSDGHLYNTANVGIRKMQGYGTQLNPEERWAIVAYVRTLQLAQAAPKSVLTPEQQRAMQ